MKAAWVLAPLLLTAGCGVTTETATPHCTSTERLALVAQSVPTANYLPCLRTLPEGWRTTGFSAERGSSTLSLLSDRSGGRPVDVVLSARCDVTAASPASARAQGVRSYVRLRTVAPNYAGTLYDVFAGGCVQYQFSFPRGPHIAMLEDLSAAVDLVPRRELRLELRKELGVELDP